MSLVEGDVSHDNVLKKPRDLFVEYRWSPTRSCPACFDTAKVA